MDLINTLFLMALAGLVAAIGFLVRQLRALKGNTAFRDEDRPVKFPVDLGEMPPRD